ncbi:hypothetical protein DPMN_046174 [Dreissena polymorpha]|uniref:Uncharacterized protein n=1 Tax=Dreissena polymorpha TaxID=45954 RepID=A0A9D4I0M4_DREPO|nr:hypothetical protein DPMN_046174 [Dreissena polymorpha]
MTVSISVRLGLHSVFWCREVPNVGTSNVHNVDKKEQYTAKSSSRRTFSGTGSDVLARF